MVTGPFGEERKTLGLRFWNSRMAAGPARTIGRFANKPTFDHEERPIFTAKRSS